VKSANDSQSLLSLTQKSLFEKQIRIYNYNSSVVVG
jgi:hypothetical protein